MIRKAEDCKIEYREHMRDGDGTVKITNLIAANEERENSINASIDLNEVKNIAITELGMKYPDQGQMVSYTNDKVDYVRQVAPAK